MTKNKWVINFTRDDGEWLADGDPAETHKTECKKGNGTQFIHCNIGTPAGRYVYTEDPLWVGPYGPNCPSARSQDDTVSVHNVTITSLVIKYKNESQTNEMFRYQLNVMDTVTNEYVPIDPVLTNTGR